MGDICDLEAQESDHNMNSTADPAEVVSCALHRPDYPPLGKFIFVWLPNSISGEQSPVSVQWTCMGGKGETLRANFKGTDGKVHDMNFMVWDIQHLSRSVARDLWNHLIECHWRSTDQ
jgi:hypothetical protein